MMNDTSLKTASLFKIDNYVDSLVKKIELLSYVNPTNIEEQKQLFFDSNYFRDPNFVYPKRDFDKFKLHREFFTQPLEEIEDERLRNLYEEIIYFYSGLIQCIETVGEGKKFYYNSLHSFGTPIEQDVENAKFILHFNAEDEESEIFQPKYSPKEAEDLFRNYSKQYDFTFDIKYSKTMGAIAMVLNNIQTLVLNENHTFSENEMGILTNHEIGVHMVTTMNGLLHPLKIFSHGFPNNVETQEGLAVFSEYMSGNLTVRRLKELAYRVLAVDSLAKGYSFSKTFRLLHNTYDLEREQAFYITTRAHRGGGFTKDYLYLTGLKKVYDYYNEGKDLKLLLTGKVSLEFVDDITYLLENKYATPIKHYTDAYLKNNNKNKTIDFILNSLK
ncbi:flavohemoglobin expression-modulating QEGLA motif protein [Tenacibaculum aquimarinum]|uniref:flavohemoglobin expression-modulating QEGLA motif protein n=1 Tax=Tenacibaculum aquimarinum TaxID=2910675 RepID=UPI001F0AA40E|nr:tyrosine/phenylalanine carboxypeptidase domain-containing protein [Tenacibaculum aquimarinum]MCH3884821.1 flavohemoglobin expression-modulating QEGLA motif protein [Tenacibaculum aquimarinum]